MAKSTRGGIVTPDAGADADVPAVMLAMGQSLEPSITPRFADTSKRNSAITSGVLDADAMDGEGLTCYVQGVGPLIYRGGGWVPMHSGVPEYQEGTGSGSVNVPDSTWTLLLTNVAGLSSGSATTIDTNTVLFPAGLYSIDVNCTWSANANGRRRMGISFSIASPPSNDNYTDTRSAAEGSTAAGLLQASQNFGSVYNPSGTARAALWVYQDSGTNLSVTARRTFVRKIA